MSAMFPQEYRMRYLEMQFIKNLSFTINKNQQFLSIISENVLKNIH